MRSSDLSAVIRNFTLMSQRLELSSDKARLEKIEQIQKKWKRPEMKGKKAKKEKADTSVSVDKIKDIDHHRLTWDDFCFKLKIPNSTLKEGLSTEEAIKRNAEQGDNALTAKKKTPWYFKLLHELTSFFSLLLWAGSILCFVAYGLDESDPSNLYLGLVLAFVVLLTGIVTFFQNSKSDSIMEGFKNFIPQMCTVMRNGKEETILASKVVTGDLLIIKEGQRIPADMRVLQANEMRVDNSSLTGESEPLLRSEKCDQPEKILETKNVAFFGTLCKQGTGRGVVFNIGDNTIIGQIAGLADTAEAGKTPLRKELDRFIGFITIIALTLGVIFFCCGFILKYKIIQNLVFAIGIIVANVPEGLLATITITLSVAAKRLSERSVLVKNLESVETLGSTSCICSDKTGTLTQNKMTVEHLWYNLKIVVAPSLEKFGPNFSYEYDIKDTHFQELQKCAVLNSAAVFSESLPEKEAHRLENFKKNHPHKYDDEFAKANAAWAEKIKTLPYQEREVIGDASETGLVKFFQPIRDIREMRKAFHLAKQFDDSDAIIPFNSAYKFALKVYEIENDPEYSHVVYMKGAPERIWEKSHYVYSGGQEIKIDKNVNNKFIEANKAFARNGERVLGFARMLLRHSDYPKRFKFNVKDPYTLPFENFCFVGLISLIDPPRETVPSAIEKCKSAGIKVIMVTGDQQLTAASIAKKIGIFEDKNSIDIAEAEGITNEQAIEMCDAIVVNGDMLTHAAKEDEGLPELEQGKKLEKWLKKSQIVFARTSPAQKLYIVRGCQKLGYIVAVTGDGVNDSPAIKQADIGIAMGITGSDVAKDSADMVLLNDDFSSIIVGIEEGRKIFDNLKKSIAYTLTSNIPEIIPFIMFIIFAIPLPISTVLILCVDLGTDIFPAVSFAFEDSELDIMTRLPRRIVDHLVTKKLLTFAYLQMGFIQTCGGFVTYFVVLKEFGLSPNSIHRIITKPYFPHRLTDKYDPSKKFFGNTAVECVNGQLKSKGLKESTERSTLEDGNDIGYTLDWLFTNDLGQDMRMGYLTANCGDENMPAKQSVEYDTCQIHQISPISLRPVCYSTEALKYAQTAFFFSIVFCQFVNNLCCKSKKLSFATQGLNNDFMILGWVVEFVLCFVLAYLRPINHVFGTRDLIFLHFGIYSLFFAMMLLIYDEIRKFLIRNFPAPKNKPNWFERNALW
jgi:sodium/potassium-transporting ATPase subunit alpha